MSVGVCVTAAQMKEIDRLTIERFGIPALTLMENAGRAVADHAMRMAAKDRPILIVSGYGNNGGDGFVAARCLIEAGRDVILFLAGKPKVTTPETEANLGKLINLRCKARLIATEGDIDAVFASLPPCGLVIDAIFGTGMRGPLDAFYAKLIDTINRSGAPVLAVDIPSGLDADTGLPSPAAVRANATVTLGLPKAGFRNMAAKAFTGDVTIADIGIPEAAVEAVLGKRGSDGA